MLIAITDKNSNLAALSPFCGRISFCPTEYLESLGLYLDYRGGEHPYELEF